MKHRNLNFRETHSERKAEGAYSNFRKETVRKFKLDSFKEKLKIKFGKFKGVK